MSLPEIQKTFEQRKINLVRTLESGRDDIELSKQHQMYGAIKELENILQTIDYFREVQTENNFDFRLSKEPDTTLLQKISVKLKGNKSKKISQ